MFQNMPSAAGSIRFLLALGALIPLPNDYPTCLLLILPSFTPHFLSSLIFWTIWGRIQF
jgi:hypothetical protein